MTAIIVALGAIALCLAVALVAVWQRSRLSLALAVREAEGEKAVALAAREAAEKALREAKEECEARIASLKAEHKERLEEEAKRWSEGFAQNVRLAQQQFTSLFEKELKERTQALKDVNREQMGGILEPLNKELLRMQALLNESSKDSARNISALQEGLKAVVEHDRERDKTTQSLANALKNRGKVQGDWGELVLEDILRDSGLRKGIEYLVQTDVTNEQGNHLRPDVIVCLNGGRNVIVDSKVSLTAYADYCGAEDDEERRLAERANCDSLWRHVCELADKEYPKLVEGSIPEVLMFVPNEGSYILAMNHRPSLGREAYDKGVIIINPTNLMLVLRLVDYCWQSSRQEENTKEILETAGRLYDKFATFAATFEKMDKGIASLRNTYNTALSQLRDGKGNISRQVEGLLRLGVKSQKAIPDQLRSTDLSPQDPCLLPLEEPEP